MNRETNAYTVYFGKFIFAQILQVMAYIKPTEQKFESTYCSGDVCIMQCVHISNLEIRKCRKISLAALDWTA